MRCTSSNKTRTMVKVEVTMIKKDKSIQILPVEISEEELKKIVAERLQMPLWMKEEEWSIQSVEANVEV